MRKQGERTLKELYDITERIKEPEITPVLEGNCRIQGPVDDLDCELQRANLGTISVAKKAAFVFHMKVESGACNLCSAPCSSCMHNNQTILAMESNIERGSSFNRCVTNEADGCSFVCALGSHVYKSRIFEDLQRTASEASNILSPSSSHGAYSENAESKAPGRVSVTCEVSEDVDMPCFVPSREDQDQLLQENRSGIGDCLFPSGSHITSDLCHSASSKLDEHGLSADALKITDLCLKNKDGLGSNEVMKSSTINNVFEMSSSLMEEASNMQEPEPQPQPVLEDGNSESEPELTDVKVCDICGDAGREDLLAFCSRCSDGAEHTYCMRKMLRKVPEGDWLCEECQVEEEAERKKVDRPQKVSGTAKECKLKADADVQKGDRPEKEYTTAKEFKHKEHADKKGNISDAVKEHAEAKKRNMPEVVFGTSKECKQVDIESKKVDASETVPRTSNQTERKETSQKFTSKSNLKLMPRLDMRVIDPDVRKVYREQQSPRFITNRHAESQEVMSPSRKRPPELSGKSTEMGSPRKKIVLSGENSFKKLDAGKAQAANMPPTNASQDRNNTEGFSRLQATLGSHSSKVQAQLQPPCRLLSRSSSFNNLKLKPRVKKLESVPVKSKITRGFSLNETKKGATNRLMRKSASFKSIISSNNTESVSKSQLIHPFPVESPRSSKQLKEMNMEEKKNSSMLNCPLTNSSPRSDSNISLPSIDIKIALHDVKLNSTSESINLRMNKGSDNAHYLGRKEAKEQSMSSPNILGSTSLNQKNNNEDQSLCQIPKGSACESPSCDKLCNNTESMQHQGVSQVTESGHQDNKPKNSSNLSGSRQAVSGGNQILRSQTCNETSHAKQFCQIDNPRSSALEPSAEKICLVGNKKRNRRKDAIESTILNSSLQKNTGYSDESVDISMFNTDAGFEVASKDLLSTSSKHPRNVPLLVETSNIQEISGISDVDPQVKDFGLRFSPPVESLSISTDVQIIDASCNPKTSNLSAELNATASVSEELNMEHLVPDQASLLANLYSTLAIPDLEFIWQGSFEILTTGNKSTPFEGIQAHMSTSASPKVLELVTKFPCKIQLEEVSWISSWPLHSQGISPDEHNIALFFFAKDIKSYESNYSKLLEKILTNDFALSGIVDGVELLIFPSTKLPLHSQRWNRLFFLWGMFKGRRADSLISELNSQKKPFGPDLNIDPVLHDLPCVVSSVVSESNKAVSVENPQKKLSRCEIPTKDKTLKSIAREEICDTSSLKVEDKMRSSQYFPPVHNSSFQNAAYNWLPVEQNSCSFPGSHSVSSTDQLSKLLISRAETVFQITNNPPFSEAKIDDTCLNKFVNEHGARHVVTPSAQVPTTNEQIRLGGASTSYSTSSDCRKGKESRTYEVGMGEEEISMKNEASFYEDPHWKQTSSCLNDAISYAHYGGHKKTIFGEECSTTCSREVALSVRSASEAHPLFLSLHDRHRDCRDDNIGGLVDHDNTRRQEEMFFPVKPNTPIHILSSDDEDAQESNSPNLELALWDRKNKQNDRQWKEPLDEEDVSASLSLSLALPSPSKERGCESNLKPEKHFQERPDVNTALLLFDGGFTDT